MSTFPVTPRTQVKRLPKRGAYDRATVYKILDEGFVCDVGFVAEGQPYVIPTGYARTGDTLYIHGSAASRMLRNLAQGAAVCVTVTLVDGLVLARSAFHHSMNYRSVLVMGLAEVVESANKKMEALRALTEHIVPGRWEDVRQPNAQELAATLVLRLPLIEAFAKIRTGPPLDDAADYDLPIWAGVIPLHLSSGNPVADPTLRSTIAPPPYAKEYARVEKQATT